MLTETALPFAHGEPRIKGLLRVKPEDFYVEEQLGFEPEGEGEHIFLWVKKENLNTEEVAKKLANCAEVAVKQVSYCGMKDRRAVTRQWFSVHVPGKFMPDWKKVEQVGLRVEKVYRHRKKLKRGAHVANHFAIHLRACEGDIDSLKDRVNELSKMGVPNYYGEQRFGRGGRNLNQAKQWFNGDIRLKRHQRGIILSAARSFLFNQILAKRVDEHSWNTILKDEVLILDGSNSVFAYTDSKESEGEELKIINRLVTGDIHPSGILYGKQKPQDTLMEVEEGVLSQFPELMVGLKDKGLDASRRALRVMPKNLQWVLHDEGVLEFKFSLPKGSYATTLLRELIHYTVSYPQ